ncbi:MAG: sugar phosphate isomerase/epimerase [Clostridia bacterium]|nr:sugar phosphate isomerase/epimerase [Clostridia bacterium]
MRISINEDYIRYRPETPRRSQMETLKLLKENGFDTADFGMFHLVSEGEPYGREDWIKKHREYCDELGIAINQTHPPFFEGRPMPDGFVERLLQCVDDSAVLGADCIVIHPDTWYKENYVQWDFDEVLNTIYEVLAPVVERAEKRGIKVAMEFMHEWLGNVYHRVRFCSNIEELDAIVGKFNCDSVGVCWDFGHAAMAYKQDQFKYMKKLKSKIIATHVHDNIFKYDNHNLPYQGSINWEEGMKTLAEVGYEGDLTLEIGYGGMPDSLVANFLQFSHQTAEYLVKQFQEFQKK